MKKGNKKVFTDKNKLYYLLNMRLCGFSYETLAVFFKVDRTSVENQCEKYDINNATKNIYNIQNILKTTFPAPIENKFIDLGGYRICKGRNYKDYKYGKLIIM